MQAPLCEVSNPQATSRLSRSHKGKEPATPSYVPETLLPNRDSSPNEKEGLEAPEAGSEGRKKRPNWTTEEDVLLAKSYVTISDDPVIGNDQKAPAFWVRVASYYNENKPKDCVHRDSGVIRSHWHNTVHRKVYRFNEDYNNIYSLHRSGHNDEDILRLAYEKYRVQNHNIAFNLEHVWRIVKDLPMFRPQFSDHFVGTKKSRTSESGASITSSNQDMTIDTDLNESEEARPIGQKIGKRKGKSKTRFGLKSLKMEYNNMVAQLAELTSLKKAEVEMKKQQIEIDRAMAEAKRDRIRLKEYKILTNDTSRMAAEALIAHEKMLESIRVKWNI